MSKFWLPVAGLAAAMSMSVLHPAGSAEAAPGSSAGAAASHVMASLPKCAKYSYSKPWGEAEGKVCWKGQSSEGSVKDIKMTGNVSGCTCGSSWLMIAALTGIPRRPAERARPRPSRRKHRRRRCPPSSSSREAEPPAGPGADLSSPHACSRLLPTWPIADNSAYPPPGVAGGPARWATMADGGVQLLQSLV